MIDIKNKTIALIGSSKNIQGKRYGPYIDSFDFVVKFNGALFLRDNEEYCKDYGYRDDIHFLTNPFVKEMKPDLDNIENPPYFLFKKKYPQYKKIQYDVISESFKQVEKTIRKGFSYSGVAVLYHLLKYKPQIIHIMSMDMYIDQPNYYDGNWDHYPEGYIPQKMKDLTDKLHSDGRLAHSRYWNAVVMKRLFLQNNNIIVDKSLWDNIEYIIQHRKDYE